MTKKLLVTASLALIIMTGCANKKIDSAENVDAGLATGDGSMYTNVDPNGANGVGSNGMYGDGAGYGDANGVQKIYFNVDQYTITPDNLSTISNNANILKNSIASGGKIKIEGHCDASGSDEYNYALGLRRAQAAKDALTMKGINGSSITLVSMGESAPECVSGTSDDCYSKNRRVEFSVIQ